jgi:hypothetical protein
MRFSRELKALTTHPRRFRSDGIKPVSKAFILRMHEVLTRDTHTQKPNHGQGSLATRSRPWH